MGVIHRECTYRGRMKASSGDLELARAGKNRCTIGLGKVNVAGDQLNLTDGRRGLPIKITGVDSSRTFTRLTDQDARDEGFETRAELISDLSKYYPSIDDQQPITVTYFELAQTEMAT